MTPKTVLITGATAGIGKAAALELAKRGANVAILARNAERAAALGLPGPVFIADLSSLADVRRAAAEIVDALPHIDVLINNAGVAATADQITAEGFDEMLASNYLGPFLLTHRLLGVMRGSAPSRIVIVGSEAHRMTAGFDPEAFEKMGTYSGFRSQLAYGRTKLLDILWADDLARQLAGTGVTVNSLCPGLVATELVREQGGVDRAMQLLKSTPFVRRPEQGAAVIVRLAMDPKLDGVTGRFFSSTPGATLVPTRRIRHDPAVARRVVERTIELVGAAV